MEQTPIEKIKDFLHTWTSLDGKHLVCTVEYLNEKVNNLLAAEKERDKQIAAKAWDAGWEYEHDCQTGSGEDYPNKEQYINSLK